MSSSTMIKDPTGNIHQGEQGLAAGAATGAAMGAAAGTVVPGVGNVVGAVVGGVIGAVVGGIGGAFQDKSAMYKRMASKWATLGKEREAAIQRRDYLRTFRYKRAEAMLGIGAEEGGTRSSAPRGAIAAMGAQYAFGEGFTEGQVSIQRKYAKMMRKAGNAAAASKTTFGLLEAGTSLVSTFGGAFTPSPSGTAGSSVGTTSPSSGGGLSSGAYSPSWGSSSSSSWNSSFSPPGR